jgi:hypothetical protein
MTSTHELARREAELNRMVLEGQIMEAFETFYAEEVVMQDHGFEPWEGKELNREREQDFVNNLTEVRTVTCDDVAIGDDVTYSTWHYDYTHAEWGDVKYDQVAVRHWKDGQVVRERFYRG